MCFYIPVSCTVLPGNQVYKQRMWKRLERRLTVLAILNCDRDPLFFSTEKGFSTLFYSDCLLSNNMTVSSSSKGALHLLSSNKLVPMPMMEIVSNIIHTNPPPKM